MTITLKDINEEFTKTIHDLVNDTRDFKSFDSHKTGAVWPIIEELERHNPELARLFMEATGIKNSRSLPDFRREFRLKALPFLPVVCCDSDKFLSRWASDKDLALYDSFNTETFTIQNEFMSFYLNELSVGATGGSNCELICEDFYNVKRIGALSQVPGENEVVLEEGGIFRIHGEYIGIKSLLSSQVLTKESTRIYYERFKKSMCFDKRRYIYISQIKP